MTKDTSSILLISKACKEFIQNDFNFDHKVIHYHKIIDLLEPNEQLQIFILKKKKKTQKNPHKPKPKPHTNQQLIMMSTHLQFHKAPQGSN